MSGRSVHIRARGTLPVLVHPLVGDVLAEHTRLPVWLGDRLELNLSVFEESGKLGLRASQGQDRSWQRYTRYEKETP